MMHYGQERTEGLFVLLFHSVGAGCRQARDFWTVLMSEARQADPEVLLLLSFPSEAV